MVSYFIQTVVVAVALLLPPNIQVLYFTNLYEKQYKLPDGLLLRLVEVESSFNAYDFKYNSKPIISNMNAYGPTQILLGTAKFVHPHMPGDSLKNLLLTDIKFSIETSAILLRYAYDKYGSWEKVMGWYYTGQPSINSYSKKFNKILSRAP